MTRQLTPETQEAILRAAVEAGSERALARKLGVEYHVIGNALRQGCTRKNEEDLRRRMGMPPITPRTHGEGHRLRVSHADWEEVLAMDYTAQDIWQLGMETARQMEQYWTVEVEAGDTVLRADSKPVGEEVDMWHDGSIMVVKWNVQPFDGTGATLTIGAETPPQT